MQFTENRKYTWIVAGVLAVLFFLPQIVQTVGHAFSFMTFHQHAIVPAKPSPLVFATPAPHSPAVVPPPAQPSRVAFKAPEVSPFVGKWIGRWIGKSPISARAMCVLTLEIRPQSEMDDRFQGLSTVACMALDANPRNDAASFAVLSRGTLHETAAKMSGKLDQRTIVFHIDKVVGPVQVSDAMKTLTVASIGSDHLVAQWQGGRMVLAKATR